jgi:hypothetical protein
MKVSVISLMLLIVLACSHAACQSSKKTPSGADAKSNDDELLLGTWLRSHEEKGKAGAGIIFRNNKYFTFPPARGRDGFTFTTGSRCIYLGIAPADGTLEQPGKYGWGSKGQLKITLENGNSFNYKVIELTKEKLVVIEE